MGWARGGNKIEFAFSLQFQWISWKPEEDSLEAGRLYSLEKLRLRLLDQNLGTQKEEESELKYLSVTHP